MHDQVSVEEYYSSFSISIGLKPTSSGNKYQSSGGKDYFFYLIAGYSNLRKEHILGSDLNGIFQVIIDSYGHVYKMTT